MKDPKPGLQDPPPLGSIHHLPQSPTSLGNKYINETRRLCVHSSCSCAPRPFLALVYPQLFPHTHPHSKLSKKPERCLKPNSNPGLHQLPGIQTSLSNHNFFVMCLVSFFFNAWVLVFFQSFTIHFKQLLGVFFLPTLPGYIQPVSLTSLMQLTFQGRANVHACTGQGLGDNEAPNTNLISKIPLLPASTGSWVQPAKFPAGRE